MPRALIRRRTLGIMSAACAAGVFAPLLAARSRAAALGDRLTLGVAADPATIHGNRELISQALAKRSTHGRARVAQVRPW